MAFLSDKVDLHELLQMMRERRGGSAEPRLQLPDGQAFMPHAHQRAVDGETSGVAQGFELSGGIYEFHSLKLMSLRSSVNYISRNIEL